MVHHETTYTGVPTSGIAQLRARYQSLSKYFWCAAVTSPLGGPIPRQCLYVADDGYGVGYKRITNSMMLHVYICLQRMQLVQQDGPLHHSDAPPQRLLLDLSIPRLFAQPRDSPQMLGPVYPEIHQDGRDVEERRLA